MHSENEQRSQELVRRLQIGIQAAKLAGKEALKLWQERDDLLLDMKGDHDFLGVADRICETCIRRTIERYFPEDVVLGEEYGGDIHPSLWVIDPIDGTSNYVRRLPDWCVSIAYVQDDDIELAVIFAPVMNKLYVAGKGIGATCNGVALEIAHRRSRSMSVVELDWGPGVDKEDFLELVMETFKAGFDFRRNGSAALALARVAEGCRDAFFELYSKPWDSLAGVLLVREAGGWTNDFIQGLWQAQGNPVLACRMDLVDELTANPVLQRYLSGR